VTERTHYISSLTSVRFDLGRFDRRGRFASKRGRFDYGTF